MTVDTEDNDLAPAGPAGALDPAVREARRALPTDPLRGLRALLTWITNPVSVKGAAALNTLNYSTGAPAMVELIERMEGDEEGRRVLTERPDLPATLSDLVTLGALPEGTVGRAYHAFMDRPEVVPADQLAGLLHMSGEFEELSWDEEMKYLVVRLGSTHDLVHVLSGYGTDLPAEAINIGFTIGIEDRSAGRLLSTAFAWLTTALFLPAIGGRRWRQLVMEGYERGAAAARRRPLQLLYLEELLDRPLDEVRHELGIPPRSSAERPSEAWIRNPIGRAMAHGYGKAPRSAAG